MCFLVQFLNLKTGNGKKKYDRIKGNATCSFYFPYQKTEKEDGILSQNSETQEKIDLTVTDDVALAKLLNVSNYASKWP